MRDVFGTYHPSITFAYFICVIVLGMCFRHPAYYAAAIILSALYYLMVAGKSGIRTLLVLIPLFGAITLLNPLFVPYGNTVLFTYFTSRPYTLEALTYGAATGAMFCSMILWFGCYNRVMTSDKFLCLFGRAIPSLSLVLTMVLRFVPTYQRKAHDLLAARASLGKMNEQASRKQKAADAALVLGTLVSWAFENGLTTVDSMKSRGHGLPGRTAYSTYRFGARDVALLVTLIVLAVLAALGGFSESARVEFIPSIILPALEPLGAAGLASYCMLLFIPSFIDIKEQVLWSISVSRM